MIELQVLGSTELRASDGEEMHRILAQPKRLALLTYIAIAKPRGFHRRDKLLGLFWPELSQDRARGALRKALSFLRQSLGQTVLVSRGDDEVGINGGTLDLDVLAFEAAVDAGEWKEALDLYRGDALVGLHLTDTWGFERWLEDERTRLRRRAADAARELLREEAAAGQQDHAVRAARRLTSLLPYDESALCELMEVLAQKGDRAGAIGAYEAFAASLHEEFELEPSSKTAEVAEVIRGRSHSITNAQPSRDDNGPGEPPPQTPELPRLVALPFTQLGDSSSDTNLARYLHETLIMKLAQVSGLRVLSQEAVRREWQETEPVRALGRRLRASGIISGTVEVTGERLRITARLVDVESEAVLWADAYECEPAELTSTQSQVVASIATAVQVSLFRDEKRQLADEESHVTGSLDHRAKIAWYRRSG